MASYCLLMLLHFVKICCMHCHKTCWKDVVWVREVHFKVRCGSSSWEWIGFLRSFFMDLNENQACFGHWCLLVCPIWCRSPKNPDLVNLNVVLQRYECYSSFSGCSICSMNEKNKQMIKLFKAGTEMFSLTQTENELTSFSWRFQMMNCHIWQSFLYTSMLFLVVSQTLCHAHKTNLWLHVSLHFMCVWQIAHVNPKMYVEFDDVLIVHS